MAERFIIDGNFTQSFVGTVALTAQACPPGLDLDNVASLYYDLNTGVVCYQTSSTDFCYEYIFDMGTYPSTIRAGKSYNVPLAKSGKFQFVTTSSVATVNGTTNTVSETLYLLFNTQSNNSGDLTNYLLQNAESGSIRFSTTTKNVQFKYSDQTQFLDNQIILGQTDQTASIENSSSLLALTSNSDTPFINGEKVCIQITSLADTGFPFTGSAGILGSLNVNGTISASDSITCNDLTVINTASINYLHTIYESASIIYTSGSTKFGDTIDDTHQRTGSMFVSGNISAGGITSSGNISASGTGSFSFLNIIDENSPRLVLKDTTNNRKLEIEQDNNLSIIRFDDHTTQDLKFISNNSAAHLVLDSGNGFTGLGTSTPGEKLEVMGNISASGDIIGDTGSFGQIVQLVGEDPRLRLKAVGANHPGIEWHEDSTRKWVLFNDPANDHLTFKNASNTELLELDQDGHLYVNQKIVHLGDDDTFIDFTTDDINFKAGNQNMIDLTSASQSEITFNEAGIDIDFRVEGDSDANLLFTNAGTDKVGIGTGTPGEKLEVIGNISSSGIVTANEITSSGNVKIAAGTNLPTTINSNGIDFNPESNGNGVSFKVDDTNSKTSFGGLIEFELNANRIELGQSATQHITASGNISASGTMSAAAFSGSFSGSLTGTAQTASRIAISQIGAVSTPHYLTFVNTHSVNFGTPLSVDGGGDLAYYPGPNRLNVPNLDTTNITASDVITTTISASGHLFTSTSTAGTNNYNTLVINTSDGRIYHTGSYGGGSGGSTPTLQQVTDAGSLTTTPISSSTISASGDLYVDDIFVNGVQVVENSSNEYMFGPQVGAGNTVRLQGDEITLHTNGVITASGDISASGDLNVADISASGHAYIGLSTEPHNLSAELTVGGSDGAGIKIYSSHASANRDVGLNLSCSSGGQQYSIGLGRENDSLVISPTDVNSAPVLGKPIVEISRSGSISLSGSIQLNTGSQASTPLEFNSGQIAKFGGGNTLAAGTLVVLKSDGQWAFANGTSTAASTGSLGVALSTDATNGVLMNGFVKINQLANGNTGAIGDPVYLATADGRADMNAPSGAGDVVRIIGHLMSGSTDGGNAMIHFCPSPDFILHA